MAVEDQRYEEVVKAVNALLKTGRTNMVRGWLIKLALDILRHYGYDVVLEQPQPPSQCPGVSVPK